MFIKYFFIFSLLLSQNVFSAECDDSVSWTFGKLSGVSIEALESEVDHLAWKYEVEVFYTTTSHLLERTFDVSFKGDCESVEAFDNDYRDSIERYRNELAVSGDF